MLLLPLLRIRRSYDYSYILSSAQRLSFGLLILLVFNAGPLSAQWVQQGPAPSINGQTEGLTDNTVTGAVNCVTPHPSDADILYIGATNGGVWRTTNALAAAPNWTLISGDFSSQSIGALEFDPTDASNQTLIVANGRTSSLGGAGGGIRGIFRTTSGTEPWTDIDPLATLAGLDIEGVAARGSTIVVAATNGIWRTTDTGANWAQISGAVGSGLPAGITFDLAPDPSNNARLYTNAGTAGIYRSDDTGATWTKVSNAALDGFVSNATRVEIAVGSSNNVFVAVPVAGRLAGLFRSGNSGGSWTSLDIPVTFEGCQNVGIHPGGQGGRHLSIVADPSDNNVVYIGGDRQPRASTDGGCNPQSTQGFPNSIGANNFTGRLFRVDASLAAGSQFTPITHNGTAGGSSPHADSRDMDFDANGDLLEGDDGGVYKQNSPADATGDWVSLNGRLSLSEAHSMDYDANANIVIVGLQDNGVPEQNTPAGSEWNTIRQGDGGDVAVDDLTSSTQSSRFNSTQNFGRFQMLVYSTGNAQQGATITPTLTNTATGNPINNDPLNPISFPFVTPIKMHNQNGNRLLIGTNQGIFETTDQGATVTQVLTANLAGVFVSGSDLLAYGAADNANVAYFGRGNNVMVRTTAAGNFANTAGYAGGNVTGLTIDPNDAQSAYVIDANSVFETTDQGANFDDITGDLLSLNPGTLRSIAYISNSTDDQLAVGTDQGVYLAAGPDFNDWTLLGTQLPNAPVYDLEYDATDQILVAATLGRGTWSYNLEERDPVDVALVMDFSGSMRNPACSGCSPKVDVLKDAAEIFIQLWKGLAVGNDRMGSIYFRTNISSFASGGTVLLPVIGNSNALITDLRAQSSVAGDLTAMGGGLQSAVNQLTDASRLRNIILFTDGIQNVDPGLVYPGLTIEDGQYGPNSNVNATSPATVLNTAGGIKVNTIGIGASPAFATQLSDLSDGTDGVTKVTTAPDEDLIQFYVENLVDVLRDFSPQLITYRKGTYQGSVFERFSVNPSTKRLVLKVSYERGSRQKIQVYKQKKEVTKFATVEVGAFYTIYSFSFESLRELEQILPGTDWGISITGNNSPRDFQIAVIADEELLDYRFWTKRASLRAGEPINLLAEVSVKGERVSRDIEITATICAPSVSLGDILSKSKPRNIDKFKFEPNTPLGVQMLTALRMDPKFIKQTTPTKTDVSLRAERNGTFSGSFAATQKPGVYTIIYTMKGNHPATGPFERTETRSVVVSNAVIDPGQSQVTIDKTDNQNWIWSIRPIDKFGQLLGPNYLSLLNIKLAGGKITNSREIANGTYQLNIQQTGIRSPQLQVALRDDLWFEGTLRE